MSLCTLLNIVSTAPVYGSLLLVSPECAGAAGAAGREALKQNVIKVQISQPVPNNVLVCPTHSNSGLLLRLYCCA